MPSAKTTQEPELDDTTKDPNAEWTMYFDRFQLVVLSMGLAGNLILFLFLLKHRLGSIMATTYFRSQAMVDLLACISTIIIMVQSKDEKWGSDWGDFISSVVCYVWHSQFLYWTLVFMSVQNLVLIAFERYWAIMKPFYYKQLTKKHMVIHYSIVIIYSFMLGLPSAFGTTYNAGQCADNFTFIQHFPKKDMYFWYAASWFVTGYFIPVIILTFVYSNIIIKLRKSMTGADGGVSSDVIKSKSAVKFTKAAIVITVLFIISFSFDSIYFLIGYAGIVHYALGTPFQKLGVFLVSFNSCCNPYVYFSITIFAPLKAKIQKLRNKHKKEPTTTME